MIDILLALKGEEDVNSYPDFTECIADGETLEEALQNGREALQAVIEALQAQGMPVPAPNGGGVASGKFIA